MLLQIRALFFSQVKKISKGNFFKNFIVNEKILLKSNDFPTPDFLLMQNIKLISERKNKEKKMKKQFAKRLKEVAKKDKIRKSEMKKVEDAKSCEEKKRAACQKAIEAEQRLQTSLKELQDAHALQEKIAVEVSDIRTRKEV